MWKSVMHTLQLTLEALLKIWPVVSKERWRQAQYQLTLSARLPLVKPPHNKGPAVSNKQKPTDQFTRAFPTQGVKSRQHFWKILVHFFQFCCHPK